MYVQIIFSSASVANWSFSRKSCYLVDRIFDIVCFILYIGMLFLISCFHIIVFVEDHILD